MRGSARPSTARAAPCATACPRWAAPAPSPKCAPDDAVRRASSSRWIRRASRSFTSSRFPGHACQPVIPPEATIIVRRVPDSGLRRRSGRSDPRRYAAGPRGSVRSQSRRRQRPGGDRHRPRVRRASRRALWLESAARDAAGVQRRRLSQRDGHHQRSVLAGGRGRHLARAHARVRSDSRPRGHQGSAHRPTRHRQLRELHEVPRAARPRADRRDDEEWRAGLRRHRLQRLSHTGADDRPEREPSLQPCGRAALLRSAAPRRRDRRRDSTGVGGARGDAHAGALGTAVPAAAAPRRLRGNHRGGDPAARR